MDNKHRYAARRPSQVSTNQRIVCNTCTRSVCRVLKKTQILAVVRGHGSPPSCLRYQSSESVLARVVQREPRAHALIAALRIEHSAASDGKQRCKIIEQCNTSLFDLVVLQFTAMDIDINAKLPIIRAESLELGGFQDDNNNNHNCNNPTRVTQLKPSFRKADNASYRKRSHAAKALVRSKNYYHYEEPSPEDLLDRVEYDMDEADIEWLDLFNKDIASKYKIRLSEDNFERIMDRLEKESYFENKNTHPNVDEEAVCAICNDGFCNEANAIIFCDMCDLPVHQECYGVPYVPEGLWHCRRCLQSPSRNVDCVLCPNKGGAFKQTEDGRWAHVICALWIPEVCFANTVFLEPIDNIDHIPSARWKLKCYICRQKGQGACIQCHKPNCYAPFHVTCAQQAGLFMKIRPHDFTTNDGKITDVKKEAYCDSHQPKDGKSRGGMYSDDESDDDMDGVVYKRWQKSQKDKMKKLRKILEVKRSDTYEPIAEPKVSRDKLVEISKLIPTRYRKNNQELVKMRLEIMRQIEGYWIIKRQERNGVPLLRRLQVSYTNQRLANDLNQTEKDRYTQIRWDLEKARLLIGDAKKRESMKRMLFRKTKEVLLKKLEVIDKEDPPTED